MGTSVTWPSSGFRNLSSRYGFAVATMIGMQLMSRFTGDGSVLVLDVGVHPRVPAPRRFPLVVVEVLEVRGFHARDYALVQRLSQPEWWQDFGLGRADLAAVENEQGDVAFLAVREHARVDVAHEFDEQDYQAPALVDE